MDETFLRTERVPRKCQKKHNCEHNRWQRILELKAMGAETVPSPDVVYKEITNQKNLYCYLKKKCISEKEI